MFWLKNNWRPYKKAMKVWVKQTWHQHHKQIIFDCSLHSQTLENVQSAKYLGTCIIITDNMDC